MAPALKALSLRKQFRGARGRGDVLAVDDLSLEVEKDEIYGFLGPNGAGKTTTLRMLIGLCIPDAGKISIMGHDFTGARLPARIGYLPEEHLFYPHLKVGQFLSVMGHVASDGNGGMVSVEVDRVRDMMALDPIMDMKIGDLSKGNRQKVALAQAFIGSPDLLILDEPTSGLDPLASKRLTSILTELKNESVTILLSSHRLTEVELVSDRIGLIREGKMVMEGQTSDLMAEGKAASLEELFLTVYEEAKRE
ncbi:MAG: ABC transporter ATP-binding protein [Candidatus Neomarinimicrobiota bacterium]